MPGPDPRSVAERGKIARAMLHLCQFALIVVQRHPSHSKSSKIGVVSINDRTTLLDSRSRRQTFVPACLSRHGRERTAAMRARDAGSQRLVRYADARGA